MPPWLLRLLVLGIVGAIGSELFRNQRRYEITKESNCDAQLQGFNHVITIHPNKVANLKRAHETIRNKVRSYFRTETPYPEPDFFIQGSYKMKTIVENRNTLCDVDLAVIFPRHPGVTVDTLQNHLKVALLGHTTQGITVKTNCVRLNYASDFHIDLPIYYIDEITGRMYFGPRGYDWEPSDPKAFVSWFDARTYYKPQLVRVIRYLKAWADYTKAKTGEKFPSGLALTLWAIEHYETDTRDDVALFHTCASILQHLDENYRSIWSAKMPVEPYDNVLDRLNQSQQEAFYDELKEMVSLMTDAVSSDSWIDAMGKWKRVFGNRFS